MMIYSLFIQKSNPKIIIIINLKIIIIIITNPLQSGLRAVERAGTMIDVRCQKRSFCDSIVFIIGYCTVLYHRRIILLYFCTFVMHAMSFVIKKQ
jgi:hypothetical protein